MGVKVIVKKKVPAGAATPTSNQKNGVTIIIAANRQERKPQWVKCSDALPDESGDYFALSENGTLTVCPFSRKHMAWNEYDALPLLPGNLTITHWLPIPALPKEVTRP